MLTAINKLAITAILALLMGAGVCARVHKVIARIDAVITHSLTN